MSKLDALKQLAINMESDISMLSRDMESPGLIVPHYMAAVRSILFLTVCAIGEIVEQLDDMDSEKGEYQDILDIQQELRDRAAQIGSLASTVDRLDSHVFGPM